MEIPPLITTVFNAVSSHVNKFKDLSKTQKILSVVFGVLGLPFLIVGGPLAAAFAVEAFYRFNQGNIKQQTGKENEIVQVTKDKAAEILNLNQSSSHDGDIEETQQKAAEFLEFNSFDEISYDLDRVDEVGNDHFEASEYGEEETFPKDIQLKWYPALADDETITNDLILKVNGKLIDFSEKADFMSGDAEKYLLHNPPNAHIEELMKAYLEGQSLTYVGVPSDGDCFYNSICIQLKRLEIDKDVTPKKLRNIVVEEAEKDIDHRNVLISSHKDELIERKICIESDFDPNSKGYSLDKIWDKLKPILKEAVEDYSIDNISQDERTSFKKFWSEHTLLLNKKRGEIRGLLSQYYRESDEDNNTEKTENKIVSSLNEYLKLEKTLRGNRLNLQKNFKQPLWGGTDEALLIQRRYPIHFSIIERSDGSTITKAPLSYDESKLGCRELNLIYLGSHYIPAW